MFSTQIRRFVASIFALAIVSAIAIAAIGPRYYPTIFAASVSSQTPYEPVTEQPTFTIGTCDTAGPIEIESTGGTTTPTAYATLKEAFDAINAGTHTGSINVEVCGDTAETAMASLDASGVGSTSYTDVTVRPVGGSRTIEGTLSGTSAGAIIRLNGADNVTIDGRQGGTGTARDLTIKNNSSAAGAAGVWLSSLAADAGATNNVIRNLNISCGVSNSNANTTVGIIMSGTTISVTSNGADNDNNQFLFNRITSARYGIVTRGVTTNNNIAPIVSDNIIGPESGFGPDGISKTGILMQADTGGIVSRNRVQYVGGDLANTTAGTDRAGIGIGTDAWSATSTTTITSGDYTVTGNVIRDVVEERTFSAAGIILGTTRSGSPTNNLVANNFVFNIRANGTSGDQVVGIGISGGNTDRVVFNSISLTGDMDPGAAAATTTYGNAIRIPGANGTNNANFTVANNSIYLDASSSSTATNRYYAITLNGAAYSFGTGSLNNNNYYINPANPQLQTGGLGTNTGNAITTEFAALANWQGALTTPQDANSIQSDPLYFSNTGDLHIQQASPNVNAATAITGITDDIDGQVRPNGPNPDIGADEFYPSPGSVQLGAGSYTVSEAAGMVTVTVTRTGGANGAASVDFTTGGGTATAGGSCGAGVDYVTTSGTLMWADLDAASKTFDVPVCADGILEAIETFNVTLSNPVTAALGTPSMATVSITDAGSTITGPISIGTSETFTSLTNPGGIFDAINNANVTGNITINITSDLTGESGAVALNEVAGGFTVLIKPDGAPRSITGSGTGVTVIKLNDADNVTIDGSLSGGTDRSLSITNTNLAASTAAIWIASSVNGAQNNTIKNVNIAAGADQSISSVFNFGIISSSSAAITTGGADNDNNTFDNNFIRRVSVGILAIGGFAANPNQSTTISNNVIGPDAFGPDQISTLGMLVFNENAPSIVDNEIRFIGDTATSGGSAGRDHVGISLCTGSASWSGTSAPTVVGTVTNANISRNLIHDIVERATFSSVGIVNNCPNAAPTNNIIANNMIYNILANGTAGDQTVGIGISNGNGDTVAYNSIYLAGDVDPTGATAAATSSFGISVAFANAQNLTLRNNVSVMDLNSNTGSLLHAALNLQAATFNFGTGASNNNDLFPNAANPQARVAATGGSAGTFYATLGDYQTAVAPQDANSVSVDPLFVSGTDLHLQMTSPVIGLASPLATVTNDFDGQTRDATTPDIGADEFVALPTVAFSSATYSGAEGTNATITVTRAGDTAGSSSVNYATSDGTATGGATCGAGIDYVINSGMLNFAATETSKTFDIELCSDAVAKGDETVNLTLSGPVNATLGTPAAAVLTITNVNPTAPGVLALSSATYSVGEAGGTLSITVNRTSGTDGTVSVNYGFADGSAIGGAACGGSVDYVNTAGTVNFADGEASRQFDVTICNDSTVEADETFTVALSGATGGATIGSPSSAVVTILDDDTAPTGNVVVNPGNVAYATLGEAVAAINAGTHTGAVTVDIYANTTETGSIVLNGSGAGAASYTSLVIRAAADGVTIAGPSIQGRGLIELNGADNVTIDGDNPNTAGTNRNMTVQNTAANTINFTSVIRVATNVTTVNSADNNTFRNLNVVGSSTGANVDTATATTGPQNTTFGIFSGPNATDATTEPNPITSVLTGVGTGATVGNLQVENNAVVTAARGISINGSATSVHTGLQIRDNFIGNPVAGDVNQVTSIGITANGSTGAVIADNTVYVEGFIASSAANQGINVGVNSVNTTGSTIERNVINRVRSNNPTTWSAFGINVAGVTGSAHRVQNNFVSGVINNQTAGTGGFGTTFGAFGIRIISGTNHQIYHNSVNLYGAMPGETNTNLTAAFLIAATLRTGLDVRNNIFSNQITGGNPAGTKHTVIYLPPSGTNAMDLTLNNNVYFQGTDPLSTMAQVGATFATSVAYQSADFDPSSTTPAANFRSYSSTLNAAGTNDNASLAINPQFVSNTDLHILPTSLAESRGVDVGVTNDIDGDTRPAVPDMGADEITVAGPGVIQFNSTAFTADEGTTATISVIRSGGTDGTVGVTATVTDGTATGGASCAAGIDYINPGPQVLSFGNGVSLQTFNIQLCTDAILEPGETVTLTLSDVTGGATIGTNNPATLTIRDVPPPFTGTIDVGTGGTFTSLTNPGGLFEALNEAGLSGDLTVNITSDLTAETGAVALNQLTEVGAGGYTLTIKPSGAARTISGTAAVNIGLINLNGTDRVVFDGSLSGGTDRSLTISNAQTGTSTVFWIRSAGAGNGANNNTIKNTVIHGARTTAQTTAGILAGSGTTIGGPAEAPNNNNTVTNNWIYSVQNSIYNQGNTGLDQNWTITNNEFGSSVAAEKNAFRGMLMGNATNFVITGNEVHGVSSFPTTTAAMSGIQLAFSVTNGSVSGNTIYDIVNTSSSGTGAFGLQLSAVPVSNVLIANNMIYGMSAAGSATVNSNGHGITINSATALGAGAYKLYHNSINLNTNQASGTTAALNLASTIGAAGALDVRNNIFANTQTSGATRYSVHSAAAAGVFSTINFNDYFSSGSVGFLGGVRATLAEWQTATSQDSNSLAVDPLFVSATDLHLQAGSPMINAGTPLAEVTTDIDGDARSATTPDIGADEVVAGPGPGSLQFSSATYSGSEGSSPFTVTVTRTGGATGSVSVDYATSNGTATGGAACTAGVDYITTSGTLTFADGVTSQTFDVVICDDAIDEADETFNYTLSNATGGATIGTPATAVQTIIDNDKGPVGTISIGDARVFEGKTGVVEAEFTVTFTGTGTASVNYSTANGTATAGVDYQKTSGTVTFNPPALSEEGIPSQTQTITVEVNGDSVKEANETFFVVLSNPTGAAIADGTGAGIIVDDDRAYTVDFDDDRVSDFSVYRPSENRWYTRRSTDASAEIVDQGAAGDIPVTGDYNGDSVADYAVYRPSTGQWIVALSGTQVTQTTTWGVAGDKPVQGDYDGDGKTDLAVFRPSTGEWWISRSSNGSPMVVAFGLGTDRLVQGDYDGDYKTDIAVYRDGTWYILQSSNASVRIQNWGLPTDLPVSGDFDGDGSFDLAVFRDGDWWILNSLSGTFSSFPWGLATDIPAPADYDGDGSTDVVVFRPSNGNWYVLRSSNGTTDGLNWGLAGDVPAASTVIHP
jgi:hypothetical protein